MAFLIGLQPGIMADHPIMKKPCYSAQMMNSSEEILSEKGKEYVKYI